MKIQVPTFLRATVKRGTGVRLAIFPLVALFHVAAFAQVSSEETSPNTELPESKQDLASRAGDILRHRCHGCHGPRRQKGDLRLDQEKYLLQPLSSGGTLINTDPTKSELFQRITSSDPDDRMPEDRDPLSANEIKILKRWLEAGSPWDNTEEKEAKAIKRAQLLETWSGWVIPLKPFAAPLAALLFFWLILGRLMRLRLRLRDTENPPQWQRVVGFLHKRPEALILLALASGFGIKATNAKKAEDQALNKLAIIKNKRAAQLKAGIIRRPLHPPRLGGIYYRGNDERNPKLYNNGFYRTCTFEVYLSQGDRRLAIDNPVSKEMPLKIAVKIDRAPFATQKLFNDERMTQAAITDQNTAPKQSKKPHGVNDDNTMAQSSAVSFHTLEPGECWFAAFELSTDQSRSEEEIEGELFIVPFEKAAPHFGIGYRISIKDGKISTDSEIWMGSIYHTADVLIPDERDIPLGHWFDFRPIPVIKDGNTDDPGLLGVKDYLESETKDNKQQ